MRKIIRRRWIKTMLVGGVFICIFFSTFSLNRMYIKKNTDMVTVVVAAKKINAFSAVNPDQVTLEKRPKSVVPNEALFETAPLFLGKRYYASELGFGPGDILRLDRLTTTQNNSPGNLIALAEENKMLVAVNSNLVKSCANMVGPGAVVNAIVIVKGKNLNDPDKVIGPGEDARLADLLVVDKKNADAAEPAQKGRDAIPAVVTLIMDRDNLDTAKALVQYNETGSVYLLPVGFKGDVYLATRAVLSEGESK